MDYKIFTSSDTNVSKFVFQKDNDIAVESVLYRYNSYKERTVICCSTQCGCPVGCVFCGTSKFFVRNLSTDEIVEQIDKVLENIDCETKDIEKFQIMFMSMGEPFLNYKNLEGAIIKLASKYPKAQLLISTSAPHILIHNKNFMEFISLSQEYKNIGIQFSVHESNDIDRSKLIPSKTCKLSDIKLLGETWASLTGRKPYFNYCVHENNSSNKNISELLENFNPDVWESTLSVICEKDNNMQNAINNKLDLIKSFSDKMQEVGYSIRIFNPAGQDDIGGGCGQLWFFQEWLKNNKK